MTTFTKAALGVGAGVVLTWVALVVALLVAKPPKAVLAEALRLLPDTLRLLRRLAADSSVPRGVRARLGLLLAYLALPIDLIPDLIPVLGQADDAIVTMLVLRAVVRDAGPEVVRRSWPGTPAGLAALGRLVGLPLDEAG